MKCENIKCQKEHTGSFGSGRFCSRSCSASHAPSKEQREKTSRSLKGRSTRVSDVETWKKNLSAAHARRRKEKEATILAKDFEKLSMQDKRLFVLTEQSGRCKKCELSEWLGQPMRFELDHLDGDPKNNSHQNLRMLCPNCHSQTPTWRRKNLDERVSDEDFVAALRECRSIYNATIKMKMRPNGGTYRRARKLIKQFGIKIEF